jgi:hypothetical protein
MAAFTWRLDGKTWEYCDTNGTSVGALKHDGEQYRDMAGHPLGKKFEDAKRAVMEAVEPTAPRARKRR